MEVNISALADLLRLGGPVAAILVGLSVFSLAVILAKLWQFGGVRDAEAAHAALALYRAGRGSDALDAARGAAHPAAQALAVALEGRRRGVPDALARAEAERVGAEAVEALRDWLRPLEVIATLAPLLGLFGTVLGMIAAFARLEAAGARVDPSILSGGIWEALLTTAIGLAVAMPTVAALNWFERKVERADFALAHALSGVYAADLSVERAPERDIADVRRAPRAPSAS